MRAAIYSRVSSDPRAKGRSVEEQESDCREVAGREGWEVVRVFVDNDRSASRYSKKTRPAYAELMAFVESGGADVLITWEASRFQRDLEVYVQLRELCRRHNVLWSYSGRTYDLARTDDRLSTGLDALLAERESDVTRDRVLRAVRASAIAGRPAAKIPFGYVREYDPTTGEMLRQVIREDQASLIREAAQRFLAGESCYSIAKDWNERGMKSSRNGKWDLTRVRRIIANPAVIAKRVHRGEIVAEAQWPAILDEATYRQCMAKFADPSRKMSSESAVKYLLSGIMTCKLCGSTVKVMPQRGGYKTYTCRNFCTTRKLANVDDLIERLVIARLAMPDALALLSEDAPIDESELLDKRARLNEFYDAAAEGKITPTALGRIEARLIPEIQALEKSLRRYDVPTVVYDLIDQTSVWKDLTLDQKRETIRTLMEIRLLPAVRGRKKFDEETVAVRWRGSDEEQQPAPA